MSSHDSRSRESIITGVQVLLCRGGPILDPHLAEIAVCSGYEFKLFVAGRNVPGFKLFEEQLGVAIVLNGLNELCYSMNLSFRLGLVYVLVRQAVS